VSPQRGVAMVSDAPAIHVARIGIVRSAYCHSAANCKMGEGVSSHGLCRIHHCASLADQAGGCSRSLTDAAVVWSRLVLGRHVAADVAAGLLLGAAVGGAYHVWA
jgi:hypothetical protein